jgi:glycosyltransferase involved in cell wall biosynthesis
MRTKTLAGPGLAETAIRAGLVEIVLPVHNEEDQLEAGCRKLAQHLATLPLKWRIVIVDNGSSDRTWEIATRLAGELPEVTGLHLDGKGRGRALRSAWSTSEASVLCYMDIDLSTDLACFLPLITPVIGGQSQVAVGSRLLPGCRVERGLKRELLSRGYNALLRGVLKVAFSDAQCGFKALRADAARQLLPMIKDNNWFFDTELLVLAERQGLSIFELPVEWRDDQDSRVRILETILEDLRGIARLRLMLWRQRRELEVSG